MKRRPGPEAPSELELLAETRPLGTMTDTERAELVGRVADLPDGLVKASPYRVPLEQVRALV